MHLSLVALLSTLETTFGLLVFTVTGLPKAASRLNMTKLLPTFKSWLSSLSSRKSSYHDVEGEHSHIPLGRLESGQLSKERFLPSRSKAQPPFHFDNLSTTHSTTQQTTSGLKYNFVTNEYIA